MAKSKWNLESFVAAAEAKFSFKFDYSKVIWKNVTTKVKITCKEHGDFEITPANFFTQKQPCRQCTFKYRNLDYNNRKPRITTCDFIKRAVEKHGNKYDYSLTNYIDKKTKIIFTCHNHGKIEQDPTQHLKNGCYFCNNRGISKHNKETFIEKSIAVHGEKYIYDKVDFIDLTTKVIIGCKIHGDFKISPKCHINSKQGCKKCGYIKANKKELRSKKYIDKVQKKWLDKYDYTKTIYTNKETQIIYSCKKHGEQLQNPIQHLKNGCQYCSGRGITKYNTETFVQRAVQVHGKKYQYEKLSLNNVNDYIIITCPIHGDFSQLAKNHINDKNGCPKCAAEIQVSSKENEILEYIKQYYHDDIVQSSRDILPYGLEIDIYLPKLQFGIEFHGNFFHTESKVGKTKHLKKADFCFEKSIKLIQIFEHEWENKKEIIQSRIKNFLGVNTKIYARKCNISQLTTHEKDIFLQENHIKGKDTSQHNYCLKYNDEIVACMTFGKPRFNGNYNWELIRYCSKKETNIIGGASKLLKAFRNNFNESIISYADRRWSDGNLYKQLGFKFVENTSPGYFYYNASRKKIINRMRAQKKRLQKILANFDASLTEKENMLIHGYERVYDAGNSVWILESLTT
jgi:hypothetical protein